MSIHNPDPSVMPVAERCCENCLFGSKALVDDPRRQTILDECHETGKAFICHKASMRGEYVVCRAFYNREMSLVVLLAKKLGTAKFVGLS